MYLEINPGFEFARGFLQNIDSHFDAEKSAIHQVRNTIKKISFESQDFIIKSFGSANVINQLVYGIFRDSKAKRAFQNANKLTASQISTAIPVAYAELRSLGMIRRSFFVSLKVDFDFDFHDINFERKSASDTLFTQFAEFTFKMHQAGFLHLDYTPGNILVKVNGSSFDFTIIDINRMKFGPVSWQEGASSLGKLFFKEPQMKLVSKKYAELAKTNEGEVWAIIQKSQEIFKAKKKLKKTLRFWRKK